MKKKVFCILLTFLIAISCLYNPMNVTATGIEALPFIVSTGWDSTVAAYGALKGFQYGSTSETPEIVGDYTKPYTYTSESIAPLKPSWDSFANNFFVNNWSDLYPVSSEADAQKAWELEKRAFDEKIGLGNIDMSSYLYNVLNQWLPSLVGTDYIKSGGEPVYLSLGDTITFYGNLTKYSNGVSTQSPQGLELDVKWEGYNVIGANQFVLNTGTSPVGFVCYQEINNPSVYRTRRVNMDYQQGWRDDGYWYSTPTGITLGIEITSAQWFGQFNTLSNVGKIYTNNGEPVPADKSDVPITTTEESADIISQLPVGNPNDNNDKDNKKISVLPNVPSVVGNLNNFGNINNGQLPIKFPGPNPNTGLIPSIPVLGNGGITVNIPVTNNNYEVVNNYDEHQEIYNNNYSYPTINYNYVNYYVNEGAITYEQFLQALQKYFNVIVYNNETNNYYPTTINNTTNNYYTIEEVINEEIPPILPPARISITDRFPFCLPFDIYKLLKLLNAEPTPWEWDVPVPTFVSGGTSNEYYHGEIGHVDFSETMHISLAEWEPVAKVLRTCLSVLWLVFLCFLFWKLIH